MSRTKRIKASIKEQPAFYLITNRINNKEFLLDDEAKNYLTQQMLDIQKRFHCIIHSYTILSNHYHAAIEILPENDLSDEQLLNYYRTHKRNETAIFPSETDKNQFLQNVHNLSHLVGYYQQNVAQWFNRRGYANGKSRSGKFWQGRFDSQLKENAREFLIAIGYITLNPLRAKMVKDPAEYQFCDYYQRRHNDIFRKSSERLILLLSHELGSDSHFDGDANDYFNQLFDAFLMGLPLKKGDTWDQQTVGEYISGKDRADRQAWKQSFLEKNPAMTKSLASGSYSFIVSTLEKFTSALGYKRPREPQPKNGWPGIFCIRKCRD